MIKKIILLFLVVEISVGKELLWHDDGFSNDHVLKKIISNVDNDKEDGFDFALNRGIDLRKTIEGSHKQNNIKRLKNLNAHELLEQVEELKTSIFNLKSKLYVFSEAAIKKEIIPSGLLIQYIDKSNKLFKMESILLVLNEEIIFKELFIGKKFHRKKVLYKELAPPGFYDLKLQVKMRINETGRLSYLEDYVFDLTSRKTFSVREGEKTAISIVLENTEEVFKNIKNKLKINYLIDYKNAKDLIALDNGD